MAILTTTAFANALKILYPNGLNAAWYDAAPFLAVLPKSDSFEGASKQVRVLYSGIRGSSSFAEALAAKSTPSVADFTVTRVKSYVLGSVDNEALLASRSNKGAQAKAIDTAVKSATYEFGRAMGNAVFGSGNGARGYVGTSGISTTALTLSNANDVVNFEVGMEVELSSAGTVATLRSGSATITAINRTTGVLTTDSNWTSQISGATDADYIARKGDTAACLAGLEAWCPNSTPGALFGVTRTVDTTRLAGSRISGSGAPEEEVIVDAAVEAGINGGRPDLLVMHPKRFGEMQKNLMAKSWSQVPIKTDVAKIAFRGISMPGPSGDIKIMSDPQCPYAYGWLVKKSAFELCHLGKFPHFSEEDGLKFSRESSDDALEFRLKMYGNLLCHEPKHNVCITW